METITTKIKSIYPKLSAFVMLFLLLLQGKMYSATQNSGIYSIKLPIGWNVIRKSDISDQKQLKDVQYEKFDFLFRKDNAIRVFEYPYGLLKINTNNHFYSRSPEGLPSNIVNHMSEDALLKLDNEIYLEKATGIYWQKVEIPQDDKIIIRITAFIPSYNGTYNTYFFVNKNNFRSIVPDLLQIVRETKIYADRENKIETMNQARDRGLFIIVAFFSLTIIPFFFIIYFLYIKKDIKTIMNIIKAVMLFLIVNIILSLFFKLISLNNILSMQIIEFFILTLIAFLITKGQPSQLGFKVNHEIKDQFKLLLWWALLIPPLQISLAAISNYFGFPTVGLNQSGFSKVQGGDYFKVTALLGAVSEEILFRGIIYGMVSLDGIRKFDNKFLKKMGISVPTVVSSIIFGAGHVGIFAVGASIAGVAITVTYAFIFGILLGHFREKVGSIYPGMVVHVINNSGLIFYLIKIIV
ncbi:MAG: lysostaphin resistance A-like protein [Bacillota bacterium]